MSDLLYCGACKTTMAADAFERGECPVCGNGTVEEVNAATVLDGPPSPDERPAQEAAPGPSDKPYAPHPDGRCEKCDRIRSIVCKHEDHGEFSHAGAGRYGCVDEILKELDAVKQPDQPPVTPQRIRRIVDKLAAHAVYSDIPLTGEDVDTLRDYLEHRYVK